MLRLIRCLTLAVVTALAVPALALEAPEGRSLLTVTGAIEATNHAGAAVFDRAMLEALDWREIETYTSFTDGPQRFAGPTLASLLDALGADGSALRATAINDYAIEFPIDHARDHGVLLAVDHNGTPMRVRDKGPVWVIYPLTRQEAEHKPFDGEMIWQLVRIEVLP